MKTLDNLVKVKKELENGPAEAVKLEKTLKIPHKSLYRVLNCLNQLGVARKGSNGKWVLVRDWQVFKNGHEYYVRLQHSTELLKELVSPSELVSPYTQESLKENTYVLSHLKTGYPPIYEMYKDWKEAEVPCEEAIKSFRESVRKLTEEKGFKISEHGEEVDRKWVNSHIYELVERYLRFGEYEKMNIVLDGKYVKDCCSGLILTTAQNLLEDVRELVKELLSSKEVGKNYQKMATARKDRDEKSYKYEKELGWLALKVKHGEPLEGWCSLCPKITIGRVPEE